MRFDITIRHDVYFDASPSLAEFFGAHLRNQRKIMAKIDDAITALETVGGEIAEAINQLEAMPRGDFTPEQEARFNAALDKLRSARDDARDGVNEGGDGGGGDTGGTEPPA